MKTYHFASKYRSMDFESMPSVKFVDFRFQTTDEVIAEKLRHTKDVSEITSAIEARDKGAETLDPQAQALAENEAKRNEFTPKITGGMRSAGAKSTKKEKP